MSKREHNNQNTYTDVEKLKAVGICYFNTGLTTESNASIIRCEWKSKFVYQSRSSIIAISYQIAGLQLYNNNNSILNQGAKIDVVQGSINTCWSETTANKRVLNVNGINQTQYFNRPITDEKPIFVFNTETNTMQLADEMYYFRIYINGDLRREYLPKRRVEDNVCGWYDTITNTFETGIGGGYFSE